MIPPPLCAVCVGISCTKLIRCRPTKVSAAERFCSDSYANHNQSWLFALRTLRAKRCRLQTGLSGLLTASLVRRPRFVCHIPLNTKRVANGTDITDAANPTLPTARRDLVCFTVPTISARELGPSGFASCTVSPGRYGCIGPRGCFLHSISCPSPPSASSGQLKHSVVILDAKLVPLTIRK